MENKPNDNTKGWILILLYLGLPTVIALAVGAMITADLSIIDNNYLVKNGYISDIALGVIYILGSFVLSIVLVHKIHTLTYKLAEKGHLIPNRAYPIILVILLIVVIGGYVFLFPHSSSGRGGNGKTTCLNCGRRARLTIGYCDTCYDGFSDWYDKTYIDGK